MMLAGTIVLYNPQNTVICNIESYIHDIDVLYVIDNSETVNTGVVGQIKQWDKVIYHWNRTNMGVAHALNQAAFQAIKGGFQWLALFDQDSKAAEGAIQTIGEFILSNKSKVIGIVSANQIIASEPQKKSYRPFEYYDFVITSGSVINLMIYQQVGKFDERLFIDMVDHEYCLRLKQNGYKIIKINEAILLHEVGECITLKHRNISLHSYIRIYYFVRNILYVRQRYIDIYPDLVNALSKEVMYRCIDNFIYGKSKLKQIRSAILGFYDFQCKHWGRANNLKL